MATVFLSGLVAAIVWKLYQLSKAPHDRCLRSVVLCLTSAALSYPLAMPGGATGFETVAGHGAAKLMQNLLLIATVYFLMCFYLYASADERGARRRARIEALVAASVAATVTCTVATVPHHALVGSFSSTDMTVPQAAIFYLVTGLYLMYALAAAAYWTRRYARLSGTPHSTGLWTAGAGMFGMAVACAVRAVIVGVRWTGDTVPAPVMAAVAAVLVVSSVLFVFGITYPGVRTRISLCRLWFRHRREYARLEPLWKLMAEAAPHAVLSPDSASAWERGRARGVHRRHHRRVVECRDGLVEVSPYLVPRGEGPEPLRDDSARRAAERLREAVRAHLDGSGRAAPEQPLATIPRQRSREAEVGELLVLSDALRVAN
ncbi:MAB_1171c family putative transporter [Streptomyces sp. LHD-70]|uniref:MAB_1171c family putative transporter n=1 Tax=Streptomyces sp. LHD-70 TaxID=3072140 RepID=UPI00280F1AD3|nr:MAB_1171c family putative transporter [Streptomyces sp. LHD-70]MDQ8708236.1 MAB_1171c family putative transporter [Streptomyces sp. LHD-70]